VFGYAASKSGKGGACIVEDGSTRGTAVVEYIATKGTAVGEYMEGTAVVECIRHKHEQKR